MKDVILFPLKNQTCELGEDSHGTKFREHNSLAKI